MLKFPNQTWERISWRLSRLAGPYLHAGITCSWCIILLFLTAKQSRAQVDSIRFQADTLKKNILSEKLAEGNRFTAFLNRLVFRPEAIASETDSAVEKEEAGVRRDWRLYEGKPIRSVTININDPFEWHRARGEDVSGTWFGRVGNALHRRTLSYTVKDMLLFREKGSFDSLSVQESERLIRDRKFIHEVAFTPVLSGITNDSVDLTIEVTDKWSLIVEGEVSETRLTLDITEQNFLGLGHSFGYLRKWNYINGHKAFTIRYFIPSFRNSFINGDMEYTRREDGTYSQGIDLERPFYSQLARWAGGAMLRQQQLFDTVYAEPSEGIYEKYSLITNDLWAAAAFTAGGKGAGSGLNTRLVVSGRYYRTAFSDLPDSLYDPAFKFSGESTYLAGFGINTRVYVRDRYLFNYGYIEDVPVGRSYGIVLGSSARAGEKRLYSGLFFASGDYLSWGYLGFNFEYGTFWSSGDPEQGTIHAEMNYFTRLFMLGSWKFRQFVQPQLTSGINRLETERLSLGGSSAIKGFDSPVLYGAHRMMLTLQLQSYAPYNLLGFRFGPYIVVSGGMLGHANEGFRNSRVFTRLGLGLLIRNDYLVMNNFQISLAFFPDIPGTGMNIFRTDAFNAGDLRLRDFAPGRPEVVGYK